MSHARSSMNGQVNVRLTRTAARKTVLSFILAGTGPDRRFRPS